MAKKEKDKEIEYDEEGLDFEDINFDSEINIDEFNESLGEREPSNIELAKEIGQATAKDFFSTLTKKTLEKSLPSSYSENYYTLLDYKDFVEGEFTKNKEKIRSSLFSLTKEVNKALPFKLGVLDKLQEKLSEDIEKVQEISEQQAQETAIQSTLTSIFDKQIQFTKEIEAKREAREETEFKTNLASTKLTTDILTEISNNISSSTAFTLNIAKEYYRKSLELQMRSFYIQADQLKITKEYFKAFSLQFDSIVRNTSLPDYVKLRNIENLKEVIRTETSKNIYNSIFSEETYLGKLKEKISRAISNKVNNITSRFDDLTSMLSMINMLSDSIDGSKKSLYGTIFGGLVGSVLGEKTAEKLNEKIGNRFKENKIIKAGGDLLAAFSASPVTFFTNLQRKIANKAEEYSTSTRVFQRGLGKLLSLYSDIGYLFQPDKVDINTYTKQNILDINKPAIFDNKVYASITDIIPKHLYKIYLESSSTKEILLKVFKKKILEKETEEDALARKYLLTKFEKKITDKEDTPNIVYDYINNKFTTREKYKEEVEKQLFKNKKVERMGKFTERLSSTLVSEVNKNLGKTERKFKEKDINEELKVYLNEIRKTKGDNFKLSEVLSPEFVRIFRDTTNNENVKYLLREDGNMLRLLEKVKQNEKELSATLSSYEVDLKDNLNFYPIETVKNTFLAISSILNPNKINVINLTDEEASVIAKSLTEFIFSDAGVINIETVSKGLVFKYLDSNIDEKLKKKIGMFIYNVRKIKNLSAYEYEARLLSILAVLDRNIRNTLDINPEIFRDLARIDRNIFSGKIFARNIVEGTLEKYKDRENINISELLEMSKMSSAEVAENIKREKEDLFSDIFSKGLDRISKIKSFTEEKRQKFQQTIQEFKSNVANIKTPKEASAYIISVIRSTYSEIKQIVARSYDAASKTLANLEKEVKTNTINAVQTKMSNFIKNIDDIIENEKNTYNEKLTFLSSAKEKLESVINTNNPDTYIELKNIEREIELETKYLEFKIKSLETIKNRALTLVEFVKNKNENDTIAIIFIRDKIYELIQEFNKIKAEYDKLAKAT